MEEMRPQAEKSIKTRLVLEAIVKAENIEVSDERVEEELTKMAEAYQMEVEKLKEFMGENEKKQIKEDLADVQAVWVVDYRGLTVKEAQELRRNIREAGAVMKVYKNTLMHIALKELDMADMDEILSGPSAFVFADGDPVASAKALRDFSKDNETLVIKGGIMDGKFVDAEAVKKIAALPSREELIAKLLGSLQNPMSQIVRVLNAPLEQVARTIGAIADQKNAA